MARSPESAAILDILDRPDNPHTDSNIDCGYSHPSLGVCQSFELVSCRIEFTITVSIPPSWHNILIRALDSSRTRALLGL
jgi:hypothetical protein